MSRFYKTLSSCLVCKQRFVVNKVEGRSSYSTSNYCAACSEKYYPKSAAIETVAE